MKKVLFLTFSLTMIFSPFVFSQRAFPPGYQKIQDCQNARALYPNLAPPGYDSDGDGIEDRIEDANGDCVCARPDRSCWYLPDTDRDGILDPLELSSGRAWDIDGDGTSNAFDSDSDNDGLFDYQEDRTRGFDLLPHLPSYFYVWRADASPVLYTDNNGQGVACSFLWAVFIGIQLEVNEVKNDRSELPIVHYYNSDLGVLNGWHLELLACFNGRVVPTDFNGRLDCETGESSPYAADTDSDGLPDFMERLLGTNSCLEDTDSDGLKDGEEDRNRDGLISPFETNPLNPDTDGDGLSDRIETDVPHGCGSMMRVHTNPLAVDTDGDGLTDFDEVRRFHTSPTFPDSDGDGTIDGRDACPCDPNPNCTAPPQRICKEETDDGDNPEVGGETVIREGNRIILSKKDTCFPSSRPRTDILREFYCGDSITGQILEHWYICKKPSICQTDAQGFGYCPTGEAQLIINPESIPLQ